MKFIDEATIIVQSGNGGRGCTSFRRERFVPRGGPDGGDGGKGGSIIIKATPRKRTLYHLQFNKQHKAPNGMPGLGSQKTGRSGADLTIDVPVGTIIINADDGTVLQDLTTPEQQVIVAAGGRGGLGNLHFKSSTNRSPRHAQTGEPGQTLKLKLELKSMADVGIIGLPNAGKSTLISAISSAKPKIGNYPFTTLTPNLGVVQVRGSEPFVVADIPGLIEGAHQGAGLGTRFLRHVERTRILVHLIDISAIDPQNPLLAYTTVNQELTNYSNALARKPQLVVLNKLDVAGAEQLATDFQQAMPNCEVLNISAATYQGLAELKSRMQQQLDHLNETQ